MSFRLLYPASSPAVMPDGGMIEDYYAVLGDRLPVDGVLWCSRDPDVIRRRAQLFRELAENRTLTAAFARFAASCASPRRENAEGAKKLPPESRESPGSLLAQLAGKKALFRAAEDLRVTLGGAVLRSDALTGLSRLLRDAAETKDSRLLADCFSKLPDGLTEVKSVTLGVNLDSAGHAHEAGIVSLNAFSYTADRPAEALLMAGEDRHPAEPLFPAERFRDRRLADEMNDELMKAADRVILRQLKRFGIRAERVIRSATGVEDGLAEEIRFAAGFAAFLDGLSAGSRTVRFLTGDALIPSDSPEARAFASFGVTLGRG